MKKPQELASIINKNEMVETYDKDYSVWRRLHGSHLHLIKVIEKELKKFGITFEEYQTIRVINILGGNPTVSDISRISIKGYHTIAALLNRMEKRALLVREIGASKKNPGRITLTEKGKEILNLTLKLQCIEAIMSSFTETEKERLVSLLKKLRDATILYAALQDTPKI